MPAGITSAVQNDRVAERKRIVINKVNHVLHLQVSTILCFKMPNTTV